MSRKYKNKKKRGESLLTKPANINKNILRVQKIHARLTRIRQKYIRYVVNILVRAKLKYIIIEDLTVSGMMKNKHLSKAIQKQCFYYFREWLKNKCKKYGIELRIADRFYPSSKLCSLCGNIKHDLKLKDRIYICDCGNKINRDLQASINLKECKKYKVAI